MKKLAVVTLYDDINIGNKLQNYAVQEYFQEKGFKCETLRHIEMAHKPFTFLEFKFLICRIIGYPKKRANLLRLDYKRKKCFKKFSDKHLNLGRLISIKNIPDNVNEQYDYFVTGSDQVWRNWTESEEELRYFFLMFADKNKRLSFAPSFGRAQIDERFADTYKKGIEEMRILTCREESGAELAEKLTGRKAEVILDPTMHIDVSKWKKLEKKPDEVPTKPYILAYFLGGDRAEIDKNVDLFAEQNGYEVVDIYNRSREKYYCTSPDEFLYLVHHAKLVVTDSFHACVFSILYNKQFFVYDRVTKGMGNMSSRIKTLLKRFDLEDRNIERDCLLEESCVDFSRVKSILEAEKKKTDEIFIEIRIGLKNE